MKRQILLGTLILLLGSSLITGESHAQDTSVRDQLMRVHFQNQENVWSHVQQQQKIKQIQDRALQKAKEAEAREVAAAKQASRDKWSRWIWLGILALVLGLWLVYLFWKRIQYRFQEYHELKGEAERTYEMVQQNHEWHRNLDLGIEYLDQNEYSAAIGTFEEAAIYALADHEKAETYHYLGVTYWQLYNSNRVDNIDALFKAEQHLDQVEKLDPGHKELILDNNSWLIEIYQHLKQNDKALKVTEKSIVLARELNQGIKIRKLELTRDKLESKQAALQDLSENISHSDKFFTEPTFDQAPSKYKTLYPNKTEVFS